MKSSTNEWPGPPGDPAFPHVGKAKPHQINGLPSAIAWDQARRRVKDVIDGPNTDIDRIIGAVLANGHVTVQLKETFPLLSRPPLTQRVEAAVHAALGRDRLAGPPRP